MRVHMKNKTYPLLDPYRKYIQSCIFTAASALHSDENGAEPTGNGGVPLLVRRQPSESRLSCVLGQPHLPLHWFGTHHGLITAGRGGGAHQARRHHRHRRSTERQKYCWGSGDHSLERHQLLTSHSARGKVLDVPEYLRSHRQGTPELNQATVHRHRLCRLSVT